MCLDAITNRRDENAPQVLFESAYPSTAEFLYSTKRVFGSRLGCFDIFSHLEGHRLTVRTKHKVLKWNLNVAIATGGLAYWRLRILDSQFDGVHRTGIKIESADTLSHLKTCGRDTTKLNDDLTEMMV